MSYLLSDVLRSEAAARFSVVSLFAGGGGSSTGYRLAGGHVLAMNEFIASAVQTYSANYPHTTVFPGDIRQLTGGQIGRSVGIRRGELDILDGSPPCASFSMSGKRESGWGKEKAYSETRQRVDDLFFEYVRLVSEMKPRVCIAENVPGLQIGAARGVLGRTSQTLLEPAHTILGSLSGAGYRVYHQVLNAADFGTPQVRRRLFIVGVRNDIQRRPVFPRRTVTRWVSCREAFHGLVQSDQDVKEARIEKYAIYPELRKLAPGQSSDRYFNLVKAHPGRPAPTITQTAGNIGAASVAHWDNRKFSVPELIRLQSFPDDYRLVGTYQQRVERIGRSVPPLMMKALVESLLESVL